jgi:SAM-dependent methyltransferase
MHLNSELLFRKYALTYFKDNYKVLEIGPAGLPSDYQKIVNNDSITWHGLDIYTDFIGEAFKNENFILSKNAYSFPISENTYDIVLSGQVICNVAKVWRWMEELSRIVKPGGYIITIAPVSWPNNLSPIDCWRVYPDGLNALYEDFNLNTIISLFDSLELEHFGYPKSWQKIPNFTLPNVSLTGYHNKLTFTTRTYIFVNRILSKIPFFRRFMIPIRITYDTIGIAQKPVS